MLTILISGVFVLAAELEDRLNWELPFRDTPINKRHDRVKFFKFTSGSTMKAFPSLWYTRNPRVRYVAGMGL